MLKGQDLKSKDVKYYVLPMLGIAFITLTGVAVMMSTVVR